MTSLRKAGMFRRAFAWTAVYSVGTVTFAFGIATFAYLGSFMRYSSDDYCQASTLRNFGFWGTQAHTYLEIVGRYSHTFLSSIADAIGPRTSGWIPGLILVGWFLATALACSLAMKRNGMASPLPAASFLAAAAVYLTAYQAPDRAESLLWRSGALSYAMPLAAGWAMIAAVLLFAERRGRNLAWGVVIFVIAWIGEGFSEAASTLQLAWVACAFLLALAFARPGVDGRRPLVSGFFVAFLATGLGFLLMVASPSTGSRLQTVSQLLGPPALLEGVLRASISFILESIQGLPVPSVLTLILGGAVGVAWSVRPGFRRVLPGWQVLTGTVLGLGVLVVLLASVYAAPLYALNARPDQRTMLLARHLVVVGLLALGLLWGVALGRRLAMTPGGASLAVAIVLPVLLLVSLYPIRSAAGLMETAPLYNKWAAYWDRREAAILGSGAGPREDIHVVELDNIIPRLGELSRDPRHYYNTCAADYYGVRSITADLPGWDD